jgi:hypothetical protein
MEKMQGEICGILAVVAYLNYQTSERALMKKE